MRSKRFERRDIPYRPPRHIKDRKGSVRLIFQFMHRYVWPHKWPVLLCIVLMSIATCADYLQAFYTRYAVDDILKIGNPVAVISDLAPGSSAAAEERSGAVSSRDGDGYLSEASRADDDTRPAWADRRLFYLFLIYVATFLFFNTSLRIAQQVQARVAKNITSRLREEMHDKVVGMSMSYHVANSPGRLLSRILSDVDVVQTQLMQLIVSASGQIVTLVVGFVIILSIRPVFALILVLVMIPYVIFSGQIRKKIRAVNVELRHTNACLWGYSSQKLDAVRVITAYGSEKREALNFHRLSACLLRDTVRQQHLGAMMSKSATLLVQLTTRGLLVYCTFQVLAGEMTLGTMLYINTAVTNLFMPVIALTQMFVQVSVLLVVLQRISFTLDSEQEVAEDASGVNFPTPVHSGIRLENVTFAWGPDKAPVIDHMNLDIPSGSWLCVMGASGCGKTSLLQLIARLYDPQGGRILVDGIDIAHIRFGSLRSRMSLVPQEAQILSGTIRDNIIYGRPDATPAVIMEAAKAAEAHDFIMELPVKYETLIGEKGTTLSGGQKQRVSIARALLTNPEVLLLDDCTSALDAKTEHSLQETLGRILVGKTAVIVSQRVSMAMRCDKIIVLEEGHVLEEGSHEQLLARNGYYADLFAKQTGKR